MTFDNGHDGSGVGSCGHSDGEWPWSLWLGDLDMVGMAMVMKVMTVAKLAVVLVAVRGEWWCGMVRCCVCGQGDSRSACGCGGPDGGAVVDCGHGNGGHAGGLQPGEGLSTSHLVSGFIGRGAGAR